MSTALEPVPSPRKRIGPGSKTLPQLQGNDLQFLNQIKPNPLLTSLAAMPFQANGARGNMVPNPCSTITRSKSDAPMSVSVPPPLMSPMKTKLSCVFCSDVISPEELDLSEAGNQNLRKMLKTLYHNFVLKRKTIPQDCNEAMFPFCKSCKDHVAEINRDQCAIEEAQQRIDRNVSYIERVVADAELLKLDALVKEEKSEATKLTDGILEGYRNKLRMKKKLRESLTSGKDIIILDTPIAVNRNAVMRDENIRGQFVSSRKSEPKQSPVKDKRESSSSSATTDNLGEQGMTVEVNPKDVHPDLETKQEKNEQMEEEDEETSSTDQQKDDVLTDVNAGLIAQYKESSCTMVISDIRSSETDSSGPATPIPMESDQNDIVIVKEEMARQFIQRKPIHFSGNSRTKRSIFRGVNIFRISSSEGFHSLQCGICQFTVPIWDRCVAGSSPHDRMTNHILECHADHVQIQGGRPPPAPRAVPQSAPRAAPRSAPQILTRRVSSTSAVQATTSVFQPSSSSLRLPSPQARRTRGPRRTCFFSCSNCDQKFATKILLREHNKEVHLAPIQKAPKAYENPVNAYQQLCQLMKCDICGRPVKGTKMNLLAHKFSHKNDEERKISIELGEPGSRRSMLTKSGVGLNRRQKRTRNSRGSRSRKFGSRSKTKGRAFQNAKPSIVIATGRPNTSTPVPPPVFNCHLCTRTFHRNNHLKLHLNMHLRKSQQYNAAAVSVIQSMPVLTKQQPQPTYSQVAARVPPLTLERQIIHHGSSGEQIVIGHRVKQPPRISPVKPPLVNGMENGNAIMDGANGSADIDELLAMFHK